jgi:hypothetical protein
MSHCYAQASCDGAELPGFYISADTRLCTIRKSTSQIGNLALIAYTSTSVWPDRVKAASVNGQRLT